MIFLLCRRKVLVYIFLMEKLNRGLLIFSLFFFASCKGTRFYIESRFIIPAFSAKDRLTLTQKFNLTGEMNSWHPVFGQYCTMLKDPLTHLFVCVKGQELRIVSSYPGALKGDAPIRKQPSTIEKYKKKIHDLPGAREHQEIWEYVTRNFVVQEMYERLLRYGSGSLKIKEELAKE